MCDRRCRLYVAACNGLLAGLVLAVLVMLASAG